MKPNTCPIEASGSDSGNLLPFIEKIAGMPSFALSWLNTQYESAEEFRKTARARLLGLLRYDPPETGFNAEITGRIDEGDYIRESLYFSTAPWFRVPAFFLIPKRGKPPYPGIVDLHSHGAYYQFGREKNVETKNEHPTLSEYKRLYYSGRSIGSELARRGYAVLSIDAFGFGERRMVLDDDLELGRRPRETLTADEVHYLNERMSSAEHQLAKSLFLAGTSWSGIVITDDIRSAGYLASRPEVDSGRIGCIGLSLGGTRSAYLGGLDDRVQCAVIVGAMSAHAPMIRAHAKCHTWINYVPGMYGILDFPDVAAMRVPLPLMVQHCAQDDLFPREGMKEADEKIRRIYRKAGAEGNFKTLTYDVPHQFNREMQEEAFAWLERWLG